MAANFPGTASHKHNAVTRHGGFVDAGSKSPGQMCRPTFPVSVVTLEDGAEVVDATVSVEAWRDRNDFPKSVSVEPVEIF